MFFSKKSAATAAQPIGLHLYSQGLLLNAKNYFSLAPSFAQLIVVFLSHFYFEMDSNKHDTTLIILELITETSEKEACFSSEMLYNINI